MSAADPNVREISAHDRQKLDELLGDFHRTWEPGRLDPALASLPVELPYRLAAVTGLVAVDLEMQWQQGQHIRVETYLEKYPELGTVDNVSIELLLAEFLAQERYQTAPDVNAFLTRFPQQADELRRLIALARSPRLSGQRVKPSGNTSIHSQQQAEDGPPLPEQFDRYRIQKKLGQGGMGTVYLAYDTRLDRKVALKVPRFAPGSNHENLERFYREARATATITHPNLCPLYDVGEVNNTPYLTMAYIEGWPLSKFIRPDKLLPQFGVATVVRIVAQALEEAHKRGVIHRDLKPGNIMINKRGEPIVMDFGLARWVNADKEDVRLTRSGAILGAPVYMSPEQVYGDVDAMGPGCDVYSLGVILYELLTGRLPFEGPTTAVLAKTLIQLPKPPSAYRPDVDPRLEAICLKAMAKKINDRYATMHEFAAALTEYIRAERQAQTITSLSMTKLPANGSQPSLSDLGAAAGPIALSDPGSSSGVGKKQAGVTTVTVPPSMMETNADPTEVLDADDLLEIKAQDIQKEEPSRRRPLLWAALAGGGVLAALLFAGLMTRLLWPAPTTVPPGPVAQVQDGSIQIAFNEKPDDMQVLLNGVPVPHDELAGPLKRKPGEYHLEIKASKFEPWSQTILVKNGDNPPVDVTLRPKAPVSPPVVVVPQPQEPQPGVPFEGHTGAIKSLAWSSDGRYILSGSEDFSLKLWDAVTRKVKQTFEGHTNPVTSVALSKDGTRALSGSGDGLVILWDVETGKILRRMPGHADWVRAVAMTGDGKWGLSGGDDKTVRLWNLDQGTEQKQLTGSTGTVWTVAFSADGQRAAAGGEDRTVRVWDLQALAKTTELKGHFDAVRSVVFLPDGRLLSGSDDRTLRLWDATKGTTLKQYTGHAGKVRAVAVSSDGKQAVSAAFGDKDTKDNTIRLWDIEKGTLLYGLGSATQGNNAVAFSPNDRWVISGGEDRVIRLWDASKPTTEPMPTIAPPLEAITIQAPPKHEIDRVAVSSDGRFALSAGYDGTIRYWDLAQGREVRKIQTMAKGTVHYVAFSPDNHLALSCGDDKLACLWDLSNGKLVRKFEGHTDKVWCAIFSADGKYIVTSGGDMDKTAKLWDANTAALLKTFEGHTKTVNAVALSPDGTRLLTAGWDGTLRVWDVDTARELKLFRPVGGANANISTVAFLHDGRRAVCSAGMKLKIYDVVDFKELRTLEGGHTGGIWFVTVSPGNRRLLSAGLDSFICLWDVDTGKLLQKFTGHLKAVPGVVFLPDGAHFLSGSKDATLKLWQLPRNLVDPPPLPASEEIQKETLLLQAPKTPGFVEQVSYTADGQRALWSGDDKMVHVWNLAEKKEVVTFKDHKGGVRSFALLPDGRRVLSADYDGKLLLWEINTGKVLKTFTGHVGKVKSVVVTPDGKRAVSVGDDKFLHVWDVDGGKEIFKRKAQDSGMFALTLTPDGREVFTGGGGMDRTIRRFNLATGDEIAHWEVPFDVHTLTVSPDGRFVVSGGRLAVGPKVAAGGKDKAMLLWDRETGQLLGNFIGHTAIVTCVRYSRDGRWILSTSDDGTIRLWNSATSQEMARYAPQPQKSTKGIAFSPDGRSALSCSADSGVRLWTLPAYAAPMAGAAFKSTTAADKMDRVVLLLDK